ncbi:MAG: hypothetical protein NUV97_03690 [archaeon]|nr:hypothetical protein [archaeon]MCR4323880.1 hypothetical protein [Nanoarchaeota archaeon]
MWFFKKRVVKKEVLFYNAVKKINKLKNEKINENSVVELNNIIKTFLKNKYKLDESLTVEELSDKISQKRIDKKTKLSLIDLILQIQKKEYKTKEKITEEEFKKLINYSLKIIKILSKEREILHKKNSGEKITEKPPLPKYERKDKSKTFEKLEREINSLNEKLTPSLENKEVRKEYEKIKKMYSKISDEEKRDIYPKILSTFRLK